MVEQPSRLRPAPIGAWAVMTILASSAAVFMRYCAIPATHIGFWRVFGAAAILTPFTWAQRRRAGYPPLMTRGALLTGVFLGLHFATWAWAVQHTTLANAALFIALQPLMVPWVARPLIGERLNRWEFIAAGLAGLGIVIIVAQQIAVERKHLAGTLVALFSAFLCSTYFVLSRKYRAKEHVLLFTVPVYLAAAVVQALGAWGLTGGLAVGDRSTRWALAGLILLPTVGGHTLAIYLLRHVKSQLVAYSVPAQFLLVAVWGFFLFREKPSVPFWVGATIVLAGVLLGVTRSEPPQPRPASPDHRSKVFLNKDGQKPQND